MSNQPSAKPEPSRPDPREVRLFGYRRAALPVAWEAVAPPRPNERTKEHVAAAAALAEDLAHAMLAAERPSSEK